MSDAHAIGPTHQHKHVIWNLKPTVYDIWHSMVEQVGPLDEWPTPIISLMLGKHLNHAARFSVYTFVVAGNRGNPLDFAYWCSARALFDKKGALELAELITNHKAGKLDNKYMTYMLPFRMSSAEGFNGPKEEFTDMFSAKSFFLLDPKIDVRLQRADATHGNPTNLKTQKMQIETPNATFMADEGHWFDKAVAFLKGFTSVCALPFAGAVQANVWTESNPLEALHWEDGQSLLPLSVMRDTAHIGLGEQPPCDEEGAAFVGASMASLNHDDDDEITRLRKMTADPLPVDAGAWQGEIDKLDFAYRTGLNAGDSDSMQIDERGSVLVTRYAMPSPVRMTTDADAIQHAPPRVVAATSKSDGKRKMSYTASPLKKAKDGVEDEVEMSWLWHSLQDALGHPLHDALGSSEPTE